MALLVLAGLGGLFGGGPSPTRREAWIRPASG